jgi:hypothetical protein
MRKVHGPDLVDLFGHGQRLWLLPDLKPPIKMLTGFDPKVEPQTFVNPVDSLVVLLKALDIAQVEITESEAPVAVVVRQSQQPVGYLLVLSVLLGFVLITDLAHREDLAGQSHRYTPLNYRPPGHITSARGGNPGPHHFFVKALFRILALSRSSAYIFLSRALSTPSSLSRAIIDVSIPPYLARHLQNIAELMPSSRHNPGARPASSRFKASAI